MAMSRGKIDLWDIFAVDHTFNPDVVDYGAKAAGGTRTFYIDPSSGLVEIGIDLSTYTDNVGTFKTYATASIPALGFFPATWNTAGAAVVTNEIQILDSRLDVMRGAYFRYSWSAINWLVNGAVIDSVAAGHFDSIELGPAYWPLLGVCAWMAASGVVHVLPVDPPTLSLSNTETKGQATVTGGWRKKLGGTWETFPVSLVTSELPIPEGCGCQTLVSAPLSAGNTHGFSATGFQRVFTEDIVTEHVECPCIPPCMPRTGIPTYSHHECRAGWELSAAHAVLVPDFTKTIERWQDKPFDFEAFLERSKMPRVQRIRQATCKTGTDPLSTGGGTDSSFYEAIDTHPRQSEIISVVGQDPHPIEDTLGYASLAPYLRNYSGHIAYGDIYTYDVGSGTCLVTLDCGSSIPDPCFADTYAWCLLDSSEGIRGAESGNTIPLLDSAAIDDDWRAWATYANTWVSPHWSYGYHIEDWSLLGSTAFWANYWGLIGAQWLYHPALPIGEQRRTRTLIAEAPLEQTPIAWYQTLRFGWRWLGISRFYHFQSVAPSSVAMSSASSAGWSGTDCVIVHGASMAVTPTTLTPVVEYDVGDFNAVPYMFPHIANQLQSNWSGASIASVSVRLVSQDGTSEIEIATATGTATILPSGDVQYSGSWAIDNGAGWITDLGFDDGPHVGDGDSLATMGDNERVSSFNYLAGYQSAKLRYYFTLSSLLPFTLNYPTWKAFGGSYAPIARESRQACVVFTSANAVRFGNQRFSGGASPPSIMGEGLAPNINDLLCWDNLFFHGRAHSTNVTTVLAAAFDSTEGNGVADVDEDTVALFLPKNQSLALPLTPTTDAALVSSLREIPPMANAPQKARDTNYSATGGWVLQVFALAQEPRRMVTAGSQKLVFEDPLGTPWSSLETGWPSHFAVSSHRQPVDNNEGYGYVLKDTVLFGRIRWRGCFMVGAFGDNDRSGAWNWAHRHGNYHEVWAKDGNIYHGWALSGVPWAGLDGTALVTSSGKDSEPKGCTIPRDGDLAIVFTREDPPGTFATMLSTAQTFGGSYETAVSILTGTIQPIVVKNEMGGLLFAGFLCDAGTTGPGKIKACYQGPDVTSPGATFTFKDSVGADLKFEDTGYCFVEPNDSKAAYILVATPQGASAQERYVCYDISGQAGWEML